MVLKLQIQNCKSYWGWNVLQLNVAIFLLMTKQYMVMGDCYGSIYIPGEYNHRSYEWWPGHDCELNFRAPPQHTIKIEFQYFKLSVDECKDTPGNGLFVEDGVVQATYSCRQLRYLCTHPEAIDVMHSYCPSTCNVCDKCYNYINIIDGGNRTGPVLHQICTKPESRLPIVQSTENEMLVLLHRGAVYGNVVPVPQDDGFRIVVTFINETQSLQNHCEGVKIINGSNFVPLWQDRILSDGTVGNYLPNHHCKWIILAPLDMYVSLSFTMFDLQKPAPKIGGGDVCVDQVIVYDGKERDYVLSRSCGDQIPFPHVSSGREMTVVFISDAKFNGRGFLARYHFVQTPGIPPTHCGPHTYFSEPGRVVEKNPIDNTICEWTLKAPPSMYVSLTFQDFSLEPIWPRCPHDLITVESDNIQLMKACDEKIPPTIVSITNEMTVRFTSDHSVTRDGFRFTWDWVPEPGNAPAPCVMLKNITANQDTPGYISDGSGYGISPYMPNRVCSWIIIAQPGQHIKLNFLSFDIEESEECIFDKLSVFDFPDGEHQRLLQTICGSKLPPYVLSFGPKIRVVFSTDDAIEGNGFVAEYMAINTPMIHSAKQCHDEMIIRAGPEGKGTFDDGAASMAIAANCIWIIEAPEGMFVNLTFLYFNLYEKVSDSCMMEYISIRDGGSAESFELMRVCGSDLPPSITSRGNKLWVHFYSDHSKTSDGFEIGWIITKKAANTDFPHCRPTTTLTARSGIFQSHTDGTDYRHLVNCIWEISAPIGEYVKLSWIDFALEEYNSYKSTCNDWVAVYDGSSTEALVLQRECGSIPPNPVISSKNSLTVQFVSNGKINKEGFMAHWKFISESERGANTESDKRTCNGYIHIPQFPLDTEGFIGSSYHDYVPRSKCIFDIVVPEDYLLNLSLLTLNLANQRKCPDRVMINGLAHSWRRPVKKLWSSAGKKDCSVMGKFQNIEWDGWRRVQIVFRSDKFMGASGFQIKWQFIHNVTNETIIVERITRSLLGMWEMIIVILVLCTFFSFACLIRLINVYPNFFPKSIRGLFTQDKILEPNKKKTDDSVIPGHIRSSSFDEEDHEDNQTQEHKQTSEIEIEEEDEPDIACHI